MSRKKLIWRDGKPFFETLELNDHIMYIDLNKEANIVRINIEQLLFDNPHCVDTGDFIVTIRTLKKYFPPK